jgi:hypothetical protein
MLPSTVFGSVRRMPERVAGLALRLFLFSSAPLRAGGIHGVTAGADPDLQSDFSRAAAHAESPSQGFGDGQSLALSRTAQATRIIRESSDIQWQKECFA